MSHYHMSDSVFCHRHRWKVGLMNLVDEAWMSDSLPDDDIPLPEGHMLDFDVDDKTPVLEEQPEERWSEPPLAHFLEEDEAQEFDQPETPRLQADPAAQR
mmetsp:Transcript_56193/g.162868  ORF Transcript_56193/g.162868 Transcript_56193/m.162868 type:complete len:100 (-) Transcript_56193:41-340(-)